MLNCRRIRLNNDRTQDKLPEIKAPRQQSTLTKRQNKQRQEDKKEWRRIKRQGRRTGGETTLSKPPAENINFSPVNTEDTPRPMTKQEVLETIEHLRENFARLTYNKDKSDPTIRQLTEEFSESEQHYREWEDRFLY